MNRRVALFSILTFLVLCAAAYMIVAMGTREGHATWEFNWPWIWAQDTDEHLVAVISKLRFPRVVAAILAGAALAASGLLLQGISRNPLADPFLLGISGGAGLAVVVVNAIPGLVGMVGWWIVPLVAFLGAQGATILVLSLARGTGRKVSMLGLILGGVIINSFCAALTLFLMTRFEPLRMKITSMWLAGGVGYATWQQLLVAGIAIAGALLFIRLRAAQLNAFALGEEGAGLVGVDSTRVLRQTTWTASLLAGVAVSLGGLIGYIGLIVPHVVRMLVGRDFKATLFLCAMLGAVLLLVGDGAARTILAPQEIPVGVLAALIGTPVLLVLLRREIGGGR